MVELSTVVVIKCNASEGFTLQEMQTDDANNSHRAVFDWGDLHFDRILDADRFRSVARAGDQKGWYSSPADQNRSTL